MLSEQTRQFLALRREVESALLSDLSALGPDQLRVRVTQLALELVERARWENVRLREATRTIETELHQR